MKEIPLKNGGVALVDDADYDMVAQFRWKLVTMANGRLRYAFTYHSRRMIGMHRMLFSGTFGTAFLVDHINGDGLNNTRANLRVVTRSENAKNTWRSRAGLPAREPRAA